MLRSRLRCHPAEWILIGILLAILFAQVFSTTSPTVRADSTIRYEHVYVVSPVFLYQGQQGLLVLDKRNGNVWFIPKGNGDVLTYLDPVFVVALPLNKLDNPAPR